jgi:outer membrane lipoprotein-sorting protein
MALEPYYVRAEQPDGKVWLLDRREKKAIMMNPAKKTAKITLFEDQPPDIYETLSDFKNMSPHSTKRIGQRQIGETQAIGFDASIGRDQMIVWVDSQTQLPIRIEFLGTNEWSRMEPEFIWSDIVFDVELDESLFRFDLGGYEVEEVDSGSRRWPNKTAETARLSYPARV